MTDPHPIAVGAITVRLGRPLPVAEAPASTLAPEVRDALLANGHCHYTVADDLGALVDDAVAETLADARVAAGDIDRVIFVTESLATGATKVALEDRRAGVHARFHELGLGRAPVTALTFSGCNGAVEAMELARLLVAAGRAGNVLVVAADEVGPGDSRELAPAVAVLGDGAVAAVVGRAGRASDVAILGDYWSTGFLDVATFRDPRADFAATLVTLGRALRGMSTQLPGRHEDDVLLCNNYGLTTLRMFTRMLAFPDGAAFADTLPRHGHIGCVDILVNLATVVAARPRARALYAVGTAHTALSLMRLEPIGAAA